MSQSGNDGRHSLKMRLIAQVVIASLLTQTVAPAYVWAGVVADGGAAVGKKPIVETAANGAQIVNIAPPSSRGVSTNLYTDFSVGQKGAVLNNSTTGGASSLAGSVKGNVQLGATPASIIVNEVTSTIRSTLNGSVEVLGNAADIVIANPNGISCDGCGFINTPRASLITGRSFLTSGGALGFNVNGGVLDVGASGLNARTLGELDLIAGQLKVNGTIQASKVFATVGPATVDYASLSATPGARSDAVPALAIDLAQTSNIQADRIYLVATEKGVGVNAAGRMTAGTGGIAIQADGTLTISNDLKATGGAITAGAGSIAHTAGAISSDSLVMFQSAGALSSSGGSIKGQDVVLASSGASLYTNANLEALGDLSLSSGATLDLASGTFKAGGVASLWSSGDLKLWPTKITNTLTIDGGTKTIDTYSITVLDAKGDVSLQSSNGLVSLDGSYVNAGGTLSVTGQSVGLLGPKDFQHDHAVIGYTTYDNTRQTLVAGTLNAGGDLSLLALGNPAATTDADRRGDLFITGGIVRSQDGHVALVAAGDIDIANDVTTDTTFAEYYRKRRKLFSTKIEQSVTATSDQTLKLSEISGNTVSIGAGKDLNIVASNVQATSNIGLRADGDLNILSAGEIDTSYSFHQVKKSGIFSGGGFAITIGSKTQTEITTSHSVQQTGASISTLMGDISASAGNQYTQLSSELIAPLGDIQISAKEVAIQTNNNTLSVMNSIRQTQSGLTLGASHPLITAGQTVIDMNKAKQRTSSGHIQALAMLTSALTAYNAYKDLTKPFSTDSYLPDLGNWTLSASLGTSSSTFESIYKSSVPQESSILSGGNLYINSTGALANNQGDISIIGSALSAGKALSLSAGNDIYLVASTGSTDETTRTTGRSGAIGLSLNADGLSATLAASRSRAFTNGWGTTYFPVQLSAGAVDSGGVLSLNSGRDLNLKGAIASGYTVVANVGAGGAGNLLLSSPQDESHYKAKEFSAGFALSVPIPGMSSPTATASGSLSYSQLKMLADYQSTREQTAIRAGLGGFNINVNGSVGLVGSVIASTASADKNTLSANALNYVDLVNRENVLGEGVSLLLKYSSSNGSAQPKGLGESTFGYAALENRSLGYAKSAISPATVVLRNAGSLGDFITNGRASQVKVVDSEIVRVQNMLTAAINCKPRPIPAVPKYVVSPTVLDMSCVNKAAVIKELSRQLDVLKKNKIGLSVENNALVGLSRDVNSAHQPLVPTFNAQTATKELKAAVAVTSAFGRAGFKAAGDYAATKRKEAETLRQRAANSTDDAVRRSLNDQAQALEDAWKDGGSSLAVLHAIVGAAAWGARGSAAVAANQLASPAIDALLKDQGIDITTPYGSAIRLAVGAVLGAAVGGANGTAAVFNADANNRQLHPDEIAWIKRNRSAFAKSKGISDVDAEKRLADQAFRQVQFGASGMEDADARIFLSQARGMLPGDPSIPGMNVGYMFYADASQKQNAAIYLGAILNSPGAIKFYKDNNIVQPSLAQIINAASKVSSWKEGASSVTKILGALQILGALALTPTAAAVAGELAVFAKNPVQYCTINPASCNIVAADLGSAVACGSAGVICPGGSIGGAAGKVAKAATEVGREINLVDGYYQVEGSAFKFSKYYYEKLWSTGRGAPFVQAEEVLKTATSVQPDRMPGFYKYVNGNMEMVYNPATKEVWHLQPLGK
ncbi:two-partner secretion domain-containing protein [Aquabacterium sp.]|uniref:two-partner secretion domain-containing protein n=1 Tax=Aquabacterium sp. TaxID=1872578 RepID=UPI0040377F49